MINQHDIVDSDLYNNMLSDLSLSSQPLGDYPVDSGSRDSTIDKPESQSTTWPVAHPNQQLLFNFLVYQDTQVILNSMITESTMMNITSTAIMP